MKTMPFRRRHDFPRKAPPSLPALGRPLPPAAWSDGQSPWASSGPRPCLYLRVALRALKIFSKDKTRIKGQMEGGGVAVWGKSLPKDVAAKPYRNPIPLGLEQDGSPPSVSDKAPGSPRGETAGLSSGPSVCKDPSSASAMAPSPPALNEPPGVPRTPGSTHRARAPASTPPRLSPLIIVQQWLLGPLLLRWLLETTWHTAQHRATGEGQQQAAHQHESQSPGAHRPAGACWETHQGRTRAGAGPAEQQAQAGS